MKHADKPLVLAINALLHSLAAQPSVRWLSLVTFDNDAKPQPK